MRLHAKMGSRSSRGPCGVSMRDGCDGRILNVEFFILVSVASAMGFRAEKRGT
jgi:hypothetical protein